MSTAQARLDAQFEVRKTLLANGYTPLPLTAKMCLLRGWNSLAPTEKDLGRWHRRMRASQTTGIRVDGRLVVLDFDIDDAELMDEIFDACFDIAPAFHDAPVRYGGGTAKQSWFVRLDPADAVWCRWRSQTRVRPGDDPADENATKHALELFSSGSSREVGVYGVHTPGETPDDPPLREYRWEEGVADLLATPYDLLPVVTRAQLDALVDLVHSRMDERGWELVSIIPHGVGDRTAHFDLDDSMEFDCADGVTRSYEELFNYVQSAGGRARCHAGFVDPTSRNRERCRIGLDHQERVFIVDYMTEIRHMHEDHTERSLGELSESLKTLAMELGLVTPEQWEEAATSDRDRFLDGLSRCFETYALNPAGNSGSPRFLRIDGRRDREVTPDGLRMKSLPFSLKVAGKRGGAPKYINPADAFMRSRDRKTANGYRFMPDQPAGIVEHPEGTFINTHQPFWESHVVPHDWRERSTLFLDFLEHLIPRADEREWLLNRLAHKAQHLGLPGVTPLIVTRTEGTGRNTLFAMLSSAFGGPRYVKEDVDAALILGTESRAQYNGWVLDKHFICCGEMLAEADAMTLRGKRRIMENLKRLLDPAPHYADINVKYGAAGEHWVTASYILATNHLDALPLSGDSRRFAVLRGASEPLQAKPELYARVQAQRHGGVFNPAFGASLWKLLKARDVSAFDPCAAVDFGGKASMELATRDEIDDIVDEVLDANPYGWGSLSNLVDQAQWVNERKREFPIDGGRNWFRRAAQTKIRERWPASMDDRLNVGRGGKATVVARDKAALRRAQDATLVERAEVCNWSLAAVPRAGAAAALKVIQGDKAD